MKKRIIAALAILLVLAALALLLYPTVSNYINGLRNARAIADFEEKAEKLDQESYQDLLAGAKAYNERLAARGGPLMKMTQAQRAEYDSLLDFTGTGIMGYVTIEKIGVSLPIYHGTDETVLQTGIGHLENTSLPVEGVSVHAVISGHSGLPSARLFTNIDQLEVGDTFTVRVLKETLTYEVDQIVTVLPHETDELVIQKGREYCTLLTCTPYGVNTHRLLVRGHRIETPAASDDGGSRRVQVLDLDRGRLLGINWEFILLGAAVLAGGTIIVLALRQISPNGLRRYKGRRTTRKSDKDETDHIGDRED